MEESLELQCISDMSVLCSQVKQEISVNKYKECQELIARFMCLYPDAPEPHNFYGIVLEMIGKHTLAMKHFRASADLDPTYSPALFNMERCGSFYSDDRTLAYEKADCIKRRERKRV